MIFKVERLLRGGQYKHTGLVHYACSGRQIKKKRVRPLKSLHAIANEYKGDNSKSLRISGWPEYL
jgi:hypothetical protein